MQKVMRLNTLSWRFVLSALGLVLWGATGCSERPLAPELEYSEAEVETLNEKIDTLEW